MTSANNAHLVLHRLRAVIVEDDPADAELIVSELRRMLAPCAVLQAIFGSKTDESGLRAD